MTKRYPVETLIEQAPIERLPDDIRDALLKLLGGVPQVHEPLIDADAGAKLLRLSRSGFWNAVRKDRVPNPFYPTERAPRWYASELLAAVKKTRARPADKSAKRLAAQRTALAAYRARGSKKKKPEAAIAAE